MTEDENGFINSVVIGGEKAWYMLGHTFWSKKFSERFLEILSDEYYLPGTDDKLWEKIFMAHLDKLKMKIRKYEPGVIYEFDTLDELREFDTSYVSDTRSEILKEVAQKLGITQKSIIHFKSMKGDTTEAIGFEFDIPTGHYSYLYSTGELSRMML